MSSPAHTVFNSHLPPKVVLASTSLIRRQLLLNAGLEFEVIAPNIDESIEKKRLTEIPVADIATRLAERKSLSLQKLAVSTIVVGTDQIPVVDNHTLNKPESLEEARQQLKLLRGKTHELHTAVVCSQNGVIVWRHKTVSTLIMRNFSDPFLEKYLSQCGEDILSSVGAYKFEEKGVTLFEDITGDYFSILGLPLLPLLGFLRQSGAMPA